MNNCFKALLAITSSWPIPYIIGVFFFREKLRQESKRLKKELSGKNKKDAKVETDDKAKGKDKY